MAIPTDRNQFKETCLRRLGDGVIEINVSPEQVDDRVDYALQKFFDYHFDGSLHSYFPYQLTSTDITNRFIILPSNIKDIVRVLPLSSNLMGVGMFNITYQFVLTSLDIYRYMDLTNWVSTFQNIQQLEQLLVGQTPVRWDRYGTTLYMDIDWNLVVAGEFIVVDCYISIDPTMLTKVWADPWLQKYATAQIKQVWGEILKKYNIPQIGGTTYNGQSIWNEATEEIIKLEEEVLEKYSTMPLDLIG